MFDWVSMHFGKVAVLEILKSTLHDKFPYSELLGSVFSPNAGKYGLQ